MNTCDAGAGLAEAPGSVWVASEWWAYRPSAIVDSEPWVRWAGPFESKAIADVWIGKQRGFPEGLRAGKAVLMWNESPNVKVSDAPDSAAPNRKSTL